MFAGNFFASESRAGGVAGANSARTSPNWALANSPESRLQRPSLQRGRLELRYILGFSTLLAGYGFRIQLRLTDSTQKKSKLIIK